MFFSIITMPEQNYNTEFRNVLFISFSQFGSAVAFNFVYVFLPFYISGLSPYSTRETLLWIGIIMGATGTCLAFTAPGWGSLTHRFNPKMLYILGMVSQSILLLLMGFFTNLYALLILRILQGAFGGVSTIGLIIISISSSSEKRAFNLGIFQSSLSVGQLIGPPLGTAAVAALGYAWGFAGGSLILFSASAFCYLYVTDVPPIARQTKSSIWSALDRRTMTGWMLCLVATIHLVFLPSVFPVVFEKFGADKAVALRWAGWVVMLYTCTSVIGTYVWSFLARRSGTKKMLNFLLLCGAVLPALLVFTQEIISFTVVVMLEIGMVAAIIPLTISMFAAEPKGNVIGFINAARFVAMATAPMLATSLLAFASAPALYLSVSALTLAAFLGSRAFIN